MTASSASSVSPREAGQQVSVPMRQARSSSPSSSGSSSSVIPRWELPQFGADQESVQAQVAKVTETLRGMKALLEDNRLALDSPLRKEVQASVAKMEAELQELVAKIGGVAQEVVREERVVSRSHRSSLLSEAMSGSRGLPHDLPEAVSHPPPAASAHPAFLQTPPPPSSFSLQEPPHEK